MRKSILFFISKFGFNTPQLAANLERLKIPIAEGKKICEECPTACCGDSKFLGIFFIFLTASSIFDVALSKYSTIWACSGLGGVVI
jgi:hypothetical protein